MLALACVLMLVSHIADWQMQAEQHGWKGLWWVSGYRAPKWGALDFIPHDPWHIAQTVRNWGQLSACMMFGIYWPWALWLYPPAFVVVYAFTRGLGFTLPRKLTQGY